MLTPLVFVFLVLTQNRKAAALDNFNLSGEMGSFDAWRVGND